MTGIVTTPKGTTEVYTIESGSHRPLMGLIRIPPTLRRAIKRGPLKPNQLKSLIGLEARAIGLSTEDAIQRARSGDLPRHYLADDIAQLVRLLDSARSV